MRRRFAIPNRTSKKNSFSVLEFSVQPAKHLLTDSVSPCLRALRVKRRRPGWGQTTEHAETGSAGHGRRLEEIRFTPPSALRPKSIQCGRNASVGSEGKFSNCLPCPAKRVSASSVVNLVGSVPTKSRHPGSTRTTSQFPEQILPNS